MSIKDDNFTADSYWGKAECFMGWEKYRQALIELEKARKLDEEDYCYYFKKATCLYKLNQYNKALVEIKKVLNVKTNICEKWNLKAKIELKLNNPYQALKDIEKQFIFEFDPDLYETKGFVLYKLGREDEAIDCFMNALNKSENPNPEMIINMN